MILSIAGLVILFVFLTIALMFFCVWIPSIGESCYRYDWYSMRTSSKLLWFLYCVVASGIITFFGFLAVSGISIIMAPEKALGDFDGSVYLEDTEIPEKIDVLTAYIDAIDSGDDEMAIKIEGSGALAAALGTGLGGDADEGTPRATGGQ